MTPSTFRSFAAIAVLSTLALSTVAAQAQSIRVRCDTFANRSRASVDGSALAAGEYSAVLVSGAHTAQSPLEAAVAGEVQFDFDSNPKDVAAGATKIDRRFIVNGRVTGKLLDASGNVIAKETRTCRAR
jgi:hypothetical protein